MEMMSLLSLERHGNQLNVRSALVKLMLMEVPQPSVNHQESHRGIQMETCVKHASVYIKTDRTSRNVKRQHAQHVKLMKKKLRLQDNAVENASKKFVLTKMLKEKKLPQRLEKLGINLNVRFAVVKRMQMELQSLNAKPQARHHGIQMVISVQNVNVSSAQMDRVRRSAKRRHVAIVTMMKS